MTTLTINNVDDLINIVQAHPEWRQRLVKALFPDIDVPKALQNLTKTIDQFSTKTDARFDALETRVDQFSVQANARFDALDKRTGNLEIGVNKLEFTVSEQQTDIAELKGKSYEREYRDKAAAIFGRYLKRGRDMTHDLADLLQEAEEVGQITSAEFDQVLAADLLWGGRLRRSEDEVVIVLEASWLAELTDIERARERADILQKIGVIAIPVVAGKTWSEEALSAALTYRVVVATNGRVEAESWQRQLAQ